MDEERREEQRKGLERTFESAAIQGSKVASEEET
jgi:hypothetical protein